MALSPALLLRLCRGHPQPLLLTVLLLVGALGLAACTWAGAEWLDRRQQAVWMQQAEERQQRLQTLEQEQTLLQAELQRVATQEDARADAQRGARADAQEGARADAREDAWADAAETSVEESAGILAERLGIVVLAMAGLPASVPGEKLLRLEFMAEFAVWLTYRMALAQAGLHPIEERAEPADQGRLLHIRGQYRTFAPAAQDFSLTGTGRPVSATGLVEDFTEAGSVLR